ncbi:MAG: type II toxin-antitoxin system VapC family toxin [Pseudonocardia sp.]|nr:type II toxin-antitoxin system VapC family toxin [Pseudonocardia sp.]
MDYVVLDTDVASRLHKGTLPPDMARAIDGSQHCVTFVTLGELSTWAHTHGWGVRKWTALADWLRQVVVLPYDGRVAYRWGQLTADARRRGRPRPANDTWVAACCLAVELPLATLNTKDYADFQALEGLVLVD